MANDTDSLLEICVVLRKDGSSYLSSIYYNGIPPAAVPTMLRGTLAAAMLKVPDSIEGFKTLEDAPEPGELQ